MNPAGAPGGVALVVEASGRPEALADALDLLAHEGTVLVASWYGTKVAALPLGGAFHRVAAGLLSELSLPMLATHTFPLAAVADAFAALDRAEEGLIHAALCYD